jgi:hypothetical protein
MAQFTQFDEERKKVIKESITVAKKYKKLFNKLFTYYNSETESIQLEIDILLQHGEDESSDKIKLKKLELQQLEAELKKYYNKLPYITDVEKLKRLL